MTRTSSSRSHRVLPLVFAIAAAAGASCLPQDAGAQAARASQRVKVSDLDRAVTFYTNALGFEVMHRMGRSAAFLSAGGYHHHIGLNTWESEGGGAAPPGTTGLYHFAIRYPDRASLGEALRRLRAARVTLDGASDHGVSEALYLRDPDGNGIELYWDRPKEEWPRGQSGEKLAMYTRPLDLRDLLAEVPGEQG